MHFQCTEEKTYYPSIKRISIIGSTKNLYNNSLKSLISSTHTPGFSLLPTSRSKVT